MPNVLHKDLTGADLHPPGPHTHVIADTTGLQASLDAKALSSDLATHTANTGNPHNVTKAQVGLGNVTNDAQLKAASNLSDIASTAAARANLKITAVVAHPLSWLQQAGTTSTFNLH